MKVQILMLLSIALINTSLAQDPVDRRKRVLSLPKIEVVSIKDTVKDRQYELFIKLPEGYVESDSIDYPVIYYTDAVWHVEILSAAAEYIMEQAILVGISWQKDISKVLLEEEGEHVSRYRDYTISPSQKPEVQEKYQLGQANNHLEFIRNQVITYTEDKYRTDPGNRTYFGYSTGGLFGAYILLTQPDTFKNYILGSPSLWRDVPVLKELNTDINLNANVFLSHGDKENELGVKVKELVEILESKKDSTLSLTYEVIDGNHQTAFPLTGVRSVTWLADLGK